ncbi:MAG: hypothetical protein QXR84_00280 [Candidatus Bathyarchaeia archaeon]|nr:hypothetical protein [Candidatus Bathyarchaeota archaeon]
MIDIEEFKDNLLEFVQFRKEPFDVEFIYRECVQLVDKYRIYETLYQLELEGKILRLSDGRYIATRAALRRWLKYHLIEIQIPVEIAAEAKEAIFIAPKAWRTLDSFISEAIEEYIRKILGLWAEKP